MRTRLQGALLLAVCAFAVHRLHALVHVLPLHDGTAQELFLSLVVVLTGVIGICMLIVGPALFQTYDWPPRI